MVREAAGELQLPAEAHAPRGAAIEARVYAEDPFKRFQPSTGTLTQVTFPQHARCETWIETGSEVTPHYDPLLAKIVVHGETRAEALQRLRAALAATRIDGIETNLDYLRQIARDETFARGEITTGYLQDFAYAPRSIDVIEGGTQTTVQDYPGRIGLWAVGVPPSGPVDDHAFRIANELVGNPEGAPGLEITLSGPSLRMSCDALIAVTGAALAARADGEPLPQWQAVKVRAGALIELGAVQGAGARAYLAVRGGLDVPRYLGSAATFMLGRFGGHGGRALRAGDVLHIGDGAATEPLPRATAPRYPDVWEIGVLHGPHGAPDFFTERDIAAFFATTWQVHHNSDRTGIRLIGPRPEWARKDGGEAGLHPSNIHDNAYAIGTIDYTGDMPIILGPDGPSLGGFVCPATIAKAERWKMGQLKAGDGVRFVELSACAGGAGPDPVLGGTEASAGRPRVVYRRAGDDYLLVEYGPLELDLALRFRVHTLMLALEQRRVRGIVDLTPGIRSLQIHYAPELLATDELLGLLAAIERELPAVDEIEVPTRIVHLPLSWEDPATLLAIEKYTRVVRKDAPWCPSNIEFIRRINGLASKGDVREIVFAASYLTLGLGDVYLGAPVATPLDPRHRLVTTKYNPARTWTPENAVGIGGAYLCIYGMEGPGGYQFVGRTLQVWNTYRSTREFAPGRPWLLRFFDQIRFHPVSAEELLRMREDFPQGKLALRIDEETFHFGRYRRFLAEHDASIRAFKESQRAAFREERERWAALGQDVVTPAFEEPARVEPTAALPPGTTAVTSPIAGNLWKLLVAAGEQVAAGAPVAIVEAMKTEITIVATASGRVRELRAAPGASVTPGLPLIILDCEPAASSEP
jgi:urea carboxylase